jgi:hypothetical protein
LMFVETAMPTFISRIKPGQNYKDKPTGTNETTSANEILRSNLSMKW